MRRQPNGRVFRQFLRYFIGGFEALVALFASMGFAAGVVFLVQLSLHPGVGLQRQVNVRNGGFALFQSIVAGAFGTWFGRLALRNLRDVRAKADGVRQAVESSRSAMGGRGSFQKAD